MASSLPPPAGSSALSSSSTAQPPSPKPKAEDAPAPAASSAFVPKIDPLCIAVKSPKKQFAASPLTPPARTVPQDLFAQASAHLRGIHLRTAFDRSRNQSALRLLSLATAPATSSPSPASSPKPVSLAAARAGESPSPPSAHSPSRNSTGCTTPALTIRTIHPKSAHHKSGPSSTSPHVQHGTAATSGFYPGQYIASPRGVSPPLLANDQKSYVPVSPPRAIGPSPPKKLATRNFFDETLNKAQGGVLLYEGKPFTISPKKNVNGALFPFEQFTVKEGSKAFLGKENVGFTILLFKKEYCKQGSQHLKLILQKYAAYKERCEKEGKPLSAEILNEKTAEQCHFLAITSIDAPFLHVDELSNPFEQARKNAQEGFVLYQGKRFLVAPLLRQNASSTHLLAVEGSFSKICVVNDPSKLCQGRENADLLIKVFKMIHCDRGLEYMRNILQQYRYLKDQGFPVAEIVNEKTALQDGFIIIARIPALFVPQALWQGKKLSEISPAALLLLTALRKLFDHGVEKGILLDPKPDNFGVAEGAPVLLDFREKIPAPSEMKAALCEAYAHGLRLLCCGNEEVRAFLLENIKKMAGNALAQHLAAESSKRVY